jgi:hypothetical protein
MSCLLHAPFFCFVFLLEMIPFSALRMDSTLVFERSHSEASVAFLVDVQSAELRGGRPSSHSFIGRCI